MINGEDERRHQRLCLRRLRHAVRRPCRHRASPRGAGPDADRFSDIWRTKQLEYTWTLTLAGHYADFWTLTERALDYAFARVPTVDRALRPRLLDAYLELDAFPDARPALAELKARGARLAILSNGSPRMLEAIVAASGLTGLLDAVLSVDVLRLYKPRPEVYALVTRHFGVKAQDIAFVSSNRWDVMGAASFGFRRCGSTARACRTNTRKARRCANCRR